MKNSKRLRKVLAIIGVAVVAIVISGAIYVNDYYHADDAAIETFAEADSLDMFLDEEDNIIYEPEGATTGFIFYPGGKVEHTAYIPLAQRLAKEGIVCIIAKMPCNLAVLDMDAADKIMDQFGYIENWYIGGHSLGGSMAASYAAEHADEFEGLILLGSYSTTDLTSTDLDVLSIYGSEDQVLDREKYNENKVNVPEDFVEIVIDGGCHAYFGAYGPQEGDGDPGITNEEQISIAVDSISAFLNAE